LKEKFVEEAMAMQGNGTPGTPQLKIVLPNDGGEILIANQSRYTSNVGMLYTSLSTQDLDDES
jgi:hypothetical protein